MFELISNISWGSGSDVIGAISNLVMASAALWGAKTASNWHKNKGFDTANNMYIELHSLLSRYNKIQTLLLDSYEIVNRMYGLYDKYNKEVFNPPKEYSQIQKNLSDSTFEGDHLITKFLLMNGMKVLIKEDYEIDFSDLMKEHSLLMKAVLSAQIKMKEAVQQNFADKPIDVLYEVNRSYDSAIEKLKLPLDIAQKLKIVKLADLFEIK
ncbi:hypothetical protein [Yersinia enterocolitica]|uniref:hypothetical protein n=1 Tax=Yersinia enterocolitica TaxID=630 RepID=UPI001E48A160|nr:hypothetical protein [Yersinia enterocolitica]MCE3081000.1 hypothetical protein [Yersinia enterocolitica]